MTVLGWLLLAVVVTVGVALAVTAFVINDAILGLIAAAFMILGSAAVAIVGVLRGGRP
jgi:hypothetical protein